EQYRKTADIFARPEEIVREVTVDHRLVHVVVGWVYSEREATADAGPKEILFGRQVHHILPEILDERPDAGMAWSRRRARRLLHHLPGVCRNFCEDARACLTTRVG